MYLSKLVLNPRSNKVRRDLADCHQMHRTLMSAWPDFPGQTSARRVVGLLYRIEPVKPGQPFVVLVHSRERPDWGRLPAGYLAGAPGSTAVKSVAETYRHIADGTVLRFRLRANPTRFIRQEDRPRGQRVDLRRECEKIAWLQRKGQQCGFRVGAGPGAPNLVVLPTEKLTGRRGDAGRGPVTVAATLFEGVLEVTDAAKFREALETGIGRAKAYGCGLLSVAPPRR